VLRQGRAPLAVRQVLGAGRVDLVHVHCGEDVAVLPLARLAARRHGCPVVVTVHLSVRHALRPAAPRGVVLRAAGGAAGRWLLPGMAAVIALTPPAARLLRGRRDTGRPRARDPARLRPGPVRRGGGGPVCRVHFTGFVPHVQVPAVLRNAGMFVLPSLHEDLSSALIEARAAGLPVAATRAGGTAGLVHDGVNGLLAAPRDPAALAAAISRVLAGPAAAAGLAAAARRTADAYARPGLARTMPQVCKRVTGPGHDR
jgi:glycogen(starch) synthase